MGTATIAPKRISEEMANTKVGELKSLGERLADQWPELTNDLDGMERSQMGILLQNQEEHLRQFRPQVQFRDKALQETTKVLNVGGFDKFAFPIIRAVYPNLVAQEICSVQPMQGPSSMVFYLDFITSLAKGGSPTATAGATYFDARSGPVNDEFYPSGTVPSETVTWPTPSGITTATNGQLAFFPVRPGSVSGTLTHEAGTVTFYDDGNGNNVLASTTNISASTINYATGVISMDPVAATDEPISAVVSYDYDTEASTQIPGIDLQLTASTIVAEVRKLKANWSIEA